MQNGGINGRHVLFAMIAFFGVIFAVNGVFLYSALTTHTGVVANEPYRKGLHYNDRIADEAAQEKLGWHLDLEIPQGDGLVRVTLADAEQRKVAGLGIAGRISRPSTDDFDQNLVFEEATPGTYVARIAALAEGTWQVELSAAVMKPEGERVVWRHKSRVWQKP
ncbi:MAG: FixH family protein [Hyphomicrobiaceae bacterium]